MQAAFSLILSACEFSYSFRGDKSKNQDSFLSGLSEPKEEGERQSENETALDVMLEELPPKSRALILNRLDDPPLSHFREEEGGRSKTQRAFIIELLDTLRGEGRADAKAVAALKEIAISLSQTAELEKETSESSQAHGRWIGLEGLWSVRGISAPDTGLQAFDVASCLFQVSDELLERQAPPAVRRRIKPHWPRLPTSR